MSSDTQCPICGNFRQHRDDCRVGQLERELTEARAQVRAAERLSNIYFDIAEAVVGPAKVRSERERRLAALGEEGG